MSGTERVGARTAGRFRPSKPGKPARAERGRSERDS